MDRDKALRHLQVFLLIASAVLLIFASLVTLLQPDPLSAFTFLPSWVWLIPGLFLTFTASRIPWRFRFILLGSWLFFGLFLVEDLTPPTLSLNLLSPSCWKTHYRERCQRRKELVAVMDVLKHVPEELPVLLAGDFNCNGRDGALAWKHQTQPMTQEGGEGLFSIDLKTAPTPNAHSASGSGLHSDGANLRDSTHRWRKRENSPSPPLLPNGKIRPGKGPALS